MTNLYQLFYTLYLSGFEKGNEEDAKLAIRLIQRLYKRGNLENELGEYFSTEKGEKLLKMSPYEIKKLKNPQDYKDLADAAKEKCEMEDCNLDNGAVSYYTEMAVEKKVMKENEKLLDAPIIVPIFEEAPKEEAIRKEEKAAVPQEQLMEEPEEIIEPLEEVPDLPKEEREKTIGDFMDFVIKSILDNNFRGNDVKHIYDSHVNYFLATRAFGSFFKDYLKKSDNPFAVIAEMTPVYADPATTENCRRNINDMLENIAKQIFKNKELEEKIHDAYVKNTDIKSLLLLFSNEINKLPNKEELYKKLDTGSYFGATLGRMYCSYTNPELNTILINYFKAIPGIEKSIPKDYMVSPFDDPEISNTFPHKKEIEDYKKQYDKNDPFCEVLDEANVILAEGNPDFVALTSETAESIGAAGDRIRANICNDYINKNHPDVKTEISGSNVYIRDQEQLSKVMKEEVGKKRVFDEDFRNELKSIVKEMQDAGMFDMDKFSYEIEEGTPKRYGMNALAYARHEVEEALNQKDEEAVRIAVNKFKRLDRIYEDVIGRLENLFPEDGKITANISASRNTFVPAKYRSNYKGVTMLSGLYHTLGLCKLTGIDINDYIDNPVVNTKKAVDFFYGKTALMQAFDNKNSRGDIVKNLMSHKNEISNDFTVLSSEGRAVTRAITGPLMAYNKENRKEIEANIFMISDTYYSDLANLCMTHGDIYGNNFHKTIANILLVKDKDLNPFFVNADGKEVMNPATMEMVSPVKLKEYVLQNYSFKEMEEKLKEIYQYGKNADFGENTAKVMEYLGEVIRTCDKFNNFEEQRLNNIMLKGHDAYIDIAEAETEDIKDPDFANFFKNMAGLVKDALTVNKYEDPVKQSEEDLKNYYTPKRIDFYAKAFNDELLKQNIDITKYNYENTTEGILQFMSDEAKGLHNNLPEFTISGAFFQNLKDKSFEQFDLAYPIPKELYDKNPQKAEFILNTFKHVSGETAEHLSQIEDNYMEQTGLKYEKPFAIEVNKNFEKGTEPYSIDRHTAYLKTAENFNQQYNSSVIADSSSLKFSEQNKNAILTVYNKMKNYGMLYDFPDRGEDSEKMYGLRKYAKTYSKIGKLLKEGKLDEAYEESKKYEGIMDEYHDVLNTCERMFPQDGYHCPGNISCSRMTYVPREFSERQIAQIQMNAVYNIAHLVERYKMSIEEILNNPGELLKRIAVQANKKCFKNLLDKDGSFADAVSDNEAVTDLTAARGLEALVSLEPDDSLRKKNFELSSVYSALCNGTTLLNPFVIVEDGEPTEKVDFENMKQFIAAYGMTDDLTQFFVNQPNPETGKNFENHFDYYGFIENDLRNPEDVLNNVIANVAKGVMRMNVMDLKGIDNENYINYGNFYIGAALYMKDYLNGYTGPTDSLAATAIRNFIADPVSSVADYIQANYEIHHTVNMYSDDVTSTLEEQGLKDEGLYRSVDNYQQKIANMDVSDLLKEMTKVKNKDGAEYDARNIPSLLLIAKRAHSLYASRSILNTIFSGDAKKEEKLEEKIHTICKRNGVQDRIFRLAMKNRKPHRAIYAIQNEMQMQSKMASLTPANVKKSLAAIFHKGTMDDLTEEQRHVMGKKEKLTSPEMLEKIQAEQILGGNAINEENFENAVNLYNDVKAMTKIEGLDKETKKIITQSFDIVKKDLNSKGLYEEVIELYNKHGIQKDEIILGIDKGEAIKALERMPKKVEIDDVDIEFEVNGEGLEEGLGAEKDFFEEKEVKKEDN